MIFIHLKANVRLTINDQKQQLRPYLTQFSYNSA